RARSADLAPVQPIPAWEVEGARSPAQADRRDPFEDVAKPLRSLRLTVSASHVPAGVIGGPRAPFGQDVERIRTSLERERAERRREVVVRMTAQRLAPVDDHRAIAEEAAVVAADVAVHERIARQWHALLGLDESVDRSPEPGLGAQAEREELPGLARDRRPLRPKIPLR